MLTLLFGFTVGRTSAPQSVSTETFLCMRSNMLSALLSEPVTVRTTELRGAVLKLYRCYVIP